MLFFVFIGRIVELLSSCGTKSIAAVCSCPVYRACPKCGTILSYTDNYCKHVSCICGCRFCFTCLKIQCTNGNWPCGAQNAAPRQTSLFSPSVSPDPWAEFLHTPMTDGGAKGSRVVRELTLQCSARKSAPGKCPGHPYADDKWHSQETCENLLYKFLVSTFDAGFLLYKKLSQQTQPTNQTSDSVHLPANFLNAVAFC